MEMYSTIVNAKKPFVIAMVTEVTGSAPGKVGFKMLVFPDGTIKGTVGGGDIEKKSIDHALSMLNSNKAHDMCNFILEQNVPKDADDIQTAMICGGSSQVYFELAKNRDKIILFGGGHIAQALAPIAQKLEYDIEICDNRPEYATEEKYPKEVKLRIGDYEEMATNTKLGANSYALILTHGHKHDYVVLRNLLRSNPNPKYIGMIGSKSKVGKTFEKLLADGINQESIKQVYTPVGLAIGGETPMEITIGILAEIQAVKNNKSQIVSMRELRPK